MSDADEWTTLVVHPCGCLEQSRPSVIPAGLVVLAGEMEWTEYQVSPCGDLVTCQHPLALAERGRIVNACTHGQPLWHHLAAGDICPVCRTTIVAVAAPPADGRRGAVGTEATSQASLECPRPAIIATGVAATREGAGGPPPVPTAPVAAIADPAPTIATHGPALRLPVASPSANAQHGVGSASTPAGEPETPSLENGGHGTDMTLVDRPGRGDAPPERGDAPPGPPSLFGARSTDPDTAHDAAAAVTDVQRRNVYRAVLEALVEHGPSTDHDLARYVTGKLGHPIGQTSVGVRRGELCKDPYRYVANSGHKGRTPTGAKAIRWALTPAGIDAVGVAA